MYVSSEFISLDGKAVGGIIIHPIVEIRLVGGGAGGMVQVVPTALVLQVQDEVLTYLIESIKTSDEQSAG